MSLPANRSSEAIQAALAVQQMSCAWRASSPLPIGDRHLGLRRLGAPTCSPMELQPSTVVERSCKASGAATGLPASPRHPEHARVTLHGRQRAAGTLAMRSAEFGASLRHLRAKSVENVPKSLSRVCCSSAACARCRDAPLAGYTHSLGPRECVYPTRVSRLDAALAVGLQQTRRRACHRRRPVGGDGV